MPARILRSWPTGLRKSLGAASYCLGGCGLYAVCTHYQALLEGGVGGACLQRHHVPSPNLPHYPHVLRIGYEYLAYAISVGGACPIPEHYLISPLKLVEVVEEHTAPGTSVAHAMSCQVDVSLRTLRPRQGG